MGTSRRKMKLAIFIFALAHGQDECDRECAEDAINYCELKQDLLRNKKLYDEAVDRYEQQEKDYNRLAKCWNSVKDNGGVTRKWNNHCGKEPDQPCNNLPESEARLLYEQRLGQTAGLRRTGGAMERQTTCQGKPTRIANGEFLRLPFWTLHCIVLVLEINKLNSK